MSSPGRGVTCSLRAGYGPLPFVSGTESSARSRARIVANSGGAVGAGCCWAGADAAAIRCAARMPNAACIVLVMSTPPQRCFKRVSVYASPGASTRMRPGFFTRPNRAHGSPLNGVNAGAFTDPQW
jgi:hypothetical protein